MDDKKLTEVVQNMLTWSSANPINNWDFIRFIYLDTFFRGGPKVQLEEAYIRKLHYFSDKEFKQVTEHLIEEKIIKKEEHWLSDSVLYSFDLENLSDFEHLRKSLTESGESDKIENPSKET